MSKPDVNKPVRAVKSIFLICGLGMSSWAPMVPYAKERLQLNDASLGLLLLFLGGGAITMMPVSGWLSHRFGSRIVILIGSIILAVSLPLLLLTPGSLTLGIMLFVFGAALGTVDVAMNAHGVQVQNLKGNTIMSSLHGLFSVGGLVGALGLGVLISAGLHPVWAAVSIAVLMIIIVSNSYHSLLTASAEKNINGFVAHSEKANHGPGNWLTAGVIFLGTMCFIAFLAEGAMLDWSAIFLRENRAVPEAFAGTGYAAFSIAMAAMRLMGDRIIAGFNSRVVVIAGSIVGAAGLLLAVLTPWTITAILGFLMLGSGAANIVPVFFSEAGRLPGVPPAIAIPAITTMGYAGQLAGPAALGYIAHRSSLPIALGVCGFLLVIVALTYSLRTKNTTVTA